jgi:hypothetical protein
LKLFYPQHFTSKNAWKSLPIKDFYAWKLPETCCAARFRACGARFTPGKGPLLGTNSARSRRFLEVPVYTMPNTEQQAVSTNKNAAARAAAFLLKHRNGDQIFLIVSSILNIDLFEPMKRRL